MERANGPKTQWEGGEEAVEKAGGADSAGPGVKRAAQAQLCDWLLPALYTHLISIFFT